MKQIDKAGRITIPAEVLEKSGLKASDYVGVAFNEKTGVLEITPLEIKPKVRTQQ